MPLWHFCLSKPVYSSITVLWNDAQLLPCLAGSLLWSLVVINLCWTIDSLTFTSKGKRGYHSWLIIITWKNLYPHIKLVATSLSAINKDDSMPFHWSALCWLGYRRILWTPSLQLYSTMSKVQWISVTLRNISSFQISKVPCQF